MQVGAGDLFIRGAFETAAGSGVNPGSGQHPRGPQGLSGATVTRPQATLGDELSSEEAWEEGEGTLDAAGREGPVEAGRLWS